LLFSVLDIKNL